MKTFVVFTDKIGRAALHLSFKQIPQLLPLNYSYEQQKVYLCARLALWTEMTISIPLRLSFILS